MSYHDSLTGLSNRKQLEIFFEFAIPNAKRHNTHIALLFLDLDSFKAINDKYGHAIGDLLLKEIGLRLKFTLRINDLPVRLGGDEFIIALTEIKNIEQVTEVAKRILEVIAKPMYLKQHEILITVSMGISIYPEAGENLNTLLVQADKALYEAKSEGKNTFKISQ
ncbi:GGDEF domain-containing protein [Legionella sp. km772]|uniref:GGDEF domain-containing protein n=1 Tax=Legionella sp. km772 TaxID=2498111 RepID=UPI001F412877|nr:GGDEF domain-containing protein [Legionella sp. km772]